MNLEIGADVFGADGKLGTLSQIVLEPLSERVTHLVVARGGLHPWEKLVPIEHVIRSEGDRIWTNLTSAQMETLPDSVTYTGSTPAPATPSEVPLGDFTPPGLLWPSNVLGWYFPSHPEGVPAHPHSNLPEGAHGLKSGTDVYSKDGKVGKLEEVLYDETSGKATGITIRKGFLFARELEAPMDWVERIDDRIQLKVRSDEIPVKRRRPQVAIPPRGPRR